MTSYATRLHDAIRKKGTPALVGIDPRFELLPASVVAQAEAANVGDLPGIKAAAFEVFSCELIDVVAPLVPAVKPQAAFFEELGPPGMLALYRVIRRARDAGLIVILDAKRGDIGSTAEAYARGYLAGEDPDGAAWAADALTVNPYLGADTLEPFVKVAEERGGGIYVLVRTSNPGAGSFQDLTPEASVAGTAQPLYRHVAATVEQMSAAACRNEEFGAVGAVVGATYPEELAELRAAMPHVPLLVPGYGSQGGTAADVAAAFRPDGLGALINSSRAINFAYSREPYQSTFGEDQWQQAVEAATKDMIAEFAESTPAGQLHRPESIEVKRKK